MVSKVFEKLVTSRILNHLEKCSLFSVFQYDFRSSQSITDLMMVVSDSTARAFNRFGATQAVALDICKAFDRVWYAGLLHKLKSHGILGQYLVLFLLFSVRYGLEWFWMGSLHKNIQLMLELRLHSWSYTFPTIH